VDDLPIIDRARLERITRSDSKLAAEFLAALLDEAGQILDRLTVLVEADDRVAISDAAHTLKGMSAEVGALRLRAAAAALESEVQKERWPTCLEAARNALLELQHTLARP
jgi:HPt (histidine-containing phosphotransfer) domain-containing protein